jgi:hypothetical protein
MDPALVTPIVISMAQPRIDLRLRKRAVPAILARTSFP